MASQGPQKAKPRDLSMEALEDFNKEEGRPTWMVSQLGLLQAFLERTVTVSHAFFSAPPLPHMGGGARQGLATFSKGEWAKNKAKFFFGAYGAYGS